MGAGQRCTTICWNTLANGSKVTKQSIDAQKAKFRWTLHEMHRLCYYLRHSRHVELVVEPERLTFADFVRSVVYVGSARDDCWQRATYHLKHCVMPTEKDYKSGVNNMKLGPSS